MCVCVCGGDIVVTVAQLMCVCAGGGGGDTAVTVAQLMCVCVCVWG